MIHGAASVPIAVPTASSTSAIVTIASDAVGSSRSWASTNSGTRVAVRMPPTRSS